MTVREKMISRVNLLAALITLGCVVRALEYVSHGEHGQRGYPAARKPPREALERIATQSPSRDGQIERRKKIEKAETVNGVALAKDNAELRERPRRRKRKMDRTMMALLLAYKLKFIALIPTILGGLVLLKGTALLAGFFFALFAAVLGLKVH